MNPEQIVIAHAVKVGLLAALIGLFRRGRARQCWTFTAYLSVVLACNTLITTWPARFFTPPFYLLKEALYNVLIVATAAEIAWRTFRAFPQALRRAQLVLGAVLATSFLAVTSLPWELSYADLILRYNPRLQVGSMWLFTATAVLVTWYNLPVHHVQRAVALGFGCYLFIFTTSWNAVRDFGLADINRWRAYVDLAAGIGFVGVCLYWAWAAWRPAAGPGLSERTMRILGWRAA